MPELAAKKSGHGYPREFYTVRESYRGDIEVFRQLVHKQTNRQTDGLTELFLKSLSRLKTDNFGKLGKD